jgi:hypothetical protein
MPGIMTDTDLSSNMRESSQQSLLMTMNRFVMAVNEMDDTVMIPNKLKDIPVDDIVAGGENGKAIVPLGGREANGSNGNEAPPTDLYSFYTMLNAIKTELTRGPLTEEEEEEEAACHHIDEQSKKTAAIFRHHLKGLFSVLKQLTHTAHKLTSKYQEDLGDFSSSSVTL